MTELIGGRQAILAGDLNTEPKDLEKFNTIFTYHPSGENTLELKNRYANFFLNIAPYDKKIDYVLVTKDLSVTEETLYDHEISDHRPVLATVSL